MSIGEWGVSFFVGGGVFKVQRDGDGPKVRFCLLVETRV